uniref:E3 ubiquitin protein ligase n=1 Tax=Rhizophora mucronata TaxID=61149 RepID=A0A2P2MV28_RHIMU
MGSEPDRKRRHFSSISPTPAMANKQPFAQLSEDKKLSTAVLQYQNQKLAQKIEAQKIEYSALENKFSQLKEKQKPRDSTVKAVNKSWKGLGIELESCSARTRDSNVDQAVKHITIIRDGGSAFLEDAFLSRLSQTGATECSSGNNCLDQIEEDRSIAIEKAMNSLSNSIAAINDLWHIMDGLNAAVLKELPGDGICGQMASCESQREAKNLRLMVGDLHSKNKSVARELQKCQDIDVKSKAELMYLRGSIVVRFG